MKVIDLLNKIANGEESDTITEFEFNKSIWNFFKLQDSEYCVDGWLLNQEIVITKHKEIIEEPKKIEYPILHKTAPSETTGDQMPNWRNLIDCNFEHLSKTIYQLIDEINDLKEKKK